MYVDVYFETEGRFITVIANYQNFTLYCVTDHNSIIIKTPVQPKSPVREGEPTSSSWLPKLTRMVNSSMKILTVIQFFQAFSKRLYECKKELSEQELQIISIGKITHKPTINFYTAYLLTFFKFETFWNLINWSFPKT